MTTEINRHLGATSQYVDRYDPTLLVREPRQRNRDRLGITNDNLPFIGYDTWNGYEVTALTDNGLPVQMIVKFVYPAHSEFIVESKSVKLYFGSFAMQRLGYTPEDVIIRLQETAKYDLSKLLETEVKVGVWNASDQDYWDLSFNALYDWSIDYDTLENTVDCSSIQFTDYSENTDLLEVKEYSRSGESLYHSSLLRSRCLVTKQPDSGDVFIKYTGKKHVTPESLLKYIVSFRNECHFHEEICEAIYTALWNKLDPEELSVKCLYARRGSYDICPQRVSDCTLLDNNLADHYQVHSKTPRQ